jgi:serine protease Do
MVKGSTGLRRRPSFLLIVIGLGVVSIGILGGENPFALELFKGEKETARIESARPESVPELVERIMPSVINIRFTKLVKHPARGFRSPYGAIPEDFPENSLGCGFIIDEQGYILTNNHVIEKAEEIKVILSDEEEFDAKVVGRDPKTDIALIKIETTKPLQPVTMGDSEKLLVGESVIAIGNPFGLERTVTAGIVSAKGRVIGSGPYDDFIQTDASINPGNNGGPLINMRGEVVAINTAIIAGGQGIGFAIPINMAKQILPQLKEKGKVTRGWSGVRVQKVTRELAKQFGLEKPEGALVAQVMVDSPAEKAGIQPEDIIIEFDRKKVNKMSDLARIVANTPVGKRVKVKLIRQGEEKIVDVVVDELKEEKIAKAGWLASGKELGLTVQELTPEIAKHLGIPQRSGVLVSEVKAGSPAQRADIRKGDVIKEINRRPIEDLQGYKREMARLKERGDILIMVQREENPLFVVVKRK